MMGSKFIGDAGEGRAMLAALGGDSPKQLHSQDEERPARKPLPQIGRGVARRKLKARLQRLAGGPVQNAYLWSPRTEWDPNFTWLTENEWFLNGIVLNYSPDQARGPDGKWVSGGGGGSPKKVKAPKQAKVPAHTVASIHKDIKALKKRGDVKAKDVAGIATKIASLKVADIKELKKKLGETARGPKADMARSLALKVLANRDKAAKERKPSTKPTKPATKKPAGKKVTPPVQPTPAQLPPERTKPSTVSVGTARIVDMLKPEPPVASADSFGDRVSRIVEREHGGGANFSDMLIVALRNVKAVSENLPAPAVFKDLQRQANGLDPLHGRIRIDQMREALAKLHQDYGTVKPAELMRMLPHMRYPERVHGMDEAALVHQRRVPKNILERMKD